MKRLLSPLMIMCLPLYGMHTPQTTYVYRKAELSDIPQLLTLLQKQAALESDTLATLPERFREGYLHSAIAAEKLFVAERVMPTGPVIVGSKKLYPFAHDEQTRETLEQELRCLGRYRQNTFAGRISASGEFIETGHEPTDEELITQCHVCLYDGSDFTLPEERGKGINSHLTALALDDAKIRVIELLRQKKAQHIALAYGLVCANAGKRPGEKSDRTPGIANLFKAFLRELSIPCSPDLLHYRYRAYKPTFDAQSIVCEPLPDDRSVPGFGCVLVSTLDRIEPQS